MASGMTASASSVLSMLTDEDHNVVSVALRKLNRIVDLYWAEISEHVSLIEELSEDADFPERGLASFLASKCFFHLEEYDDALRQALCAGDLFDVSERSEYVSAMISRCIDAYIRARCASGEGSSEEEKAALELMESHGTEVLSIMDRMFERCFADGEFTQALGIALESRRLDKVKESVERSGDVHGLLRYALRVCRTLVTSKDFRMTVLDTLLAMYRAATPIDHLRIFQCLQLLRRADETAAELTKLLEGTEKDTLLAYQAAFDLVDSGDMGYVTDVASAMGIDAAPRAAEEAKASEGAAEGGAAEGGAAEASAGAGAGAGAGGEDAEGGLRLQRLRRVLLGNFVGEARLAFMFGSNHSDLQVLEHMKEKVEHRSSILHNATVVAHAYMQAGTTCDHFLRDNLDWMGKANHWAKFTATASIGVVHQGHSRESMTLLEPYLPKPGQSSSPYSDGGSLYALGLIHAHGGGGRGCNGNAEVIDYLRSALADAGPVEAAAHGACLGLGLAALGSGDGLVYDSLKQSLQSADAVIGEAAALGMGLLLCGRGDSPQGETAIGELLEYAKETNHEKIIRGCAIALALLCYGLEERALPLVEQMAADRDAVLRYGAMTALSLAFCGTSSNDATRRLLHVAVSDSSDDVRRAAISGIGLVMLRAPRQVPRLVSLLAESYNAHVRYGACIAVGIACAGSALPEAVALLSPMMDDAVDFVRQSAMIAMAMVLMQRNEKECAEVKKLRDKLQSVVADKHTSTMSKTGAILATGVLDAGGRNAALGLVSGSDFVRMSAACGIAVWLQHWYWYPLMHFLSLALSPTMVCAVNGDLLQPEGFSVVTSAPPSRFAYPRKMEVKKDEKKTRVKTVELSTTAKARARTAKKELQRQASGTMEVDGGVAESKGDEEGDKEAKAEEQPSQDAAPEPKEFRLQNPSRLTPSQALLTAFDPQCRYQAVGHEQRAAGIIVVADLRPDDGEDELREVVMPTIGGDEDMADMPEPFLFSPEEQQQQPQPAE